MAIVVEAPDGAVHRFDSLTEAENEMRALYEQSWDDRAAAMLDQVHSLLREFDSIMEVEGKGTGNGEGV